ncbi:hypothetical protein ACTWPT_29735 [Nonomuraea sp. 3N208]|uniref:hypothetical protein n=1 Tax=Nonomuraea sp. 3N208 TaxID=3457421 RepID=UPI003FD26BBA
MAMVGFDLSGPHLDRVRVGELVLLRRLGVMVRDERWMTVPGRLRRADRGPGGRLELEVWHGSDFRWRGSVAVEGDSLTFEVDGWALRDFSRARIGLCLIHPLHLAGTAVEMNGVAAGVFPERISPHQLFTGIRTLRYRDAGVVVGIELEGETFETEDHRNWSDAGYKTYGTPLAAPWPVLVRRGEHIRQRLRLTATPAPSTPRTALNDLTAPAAPAVRVRARRTLPPVGLALVRPSAGLPEAPVAFVHATVDLDGSEWRETVARLPATGRPLVLSAVCSSPDRLADLRAAWPATDQQAGGGAPSDQRAPQSTSGDQCAPLDTLLVFDRDHGTPRKLAVAAREAFAGTGVRIGGGSRAHFAELNRAHDLPADVLDLVCFPIAAHAHHDDEDSARETLLVHPALVRQAAEHGRPVFAGPVGLLPAFGFAAPPTTAPSPSFEAAWAVGAVAALAKAGAAAISLAAPARHLIIALHPFTGGELFDPGVPPELESLAVRRDDRTLVLAAALNNAEPGTIDTRGHAVTTITEDDGVHDHPPGTTSITLAAPSIAILTTPPGGDL